MGMIVLALVGLLAGAGVSEQAVVDTPNCEDHNPDTPCCPLEERNNIALIDAWLDCANMRQELPVEPRSA